MYETEKLKLNYGLIIYILSANWAWVRWGIPPQASCTNIKIYWSEGIAVHPILYN